MPSRYPYFAALLVSMLLLLGACPSSDDDDDDDNTIEAPAACSNPSLSNVSFSFTIHYDGEDYPQSEMLGLMEEWNMETFAFNFTPALITELGPDPDSNRMAVTLLDATPVKEGDPPPEDPNWIRIVYELPLGYELPVAVGQEIGSVVGIDVSRGSLITAFVFFDVIENEEGPPDVEVLFLAEPSDLGSFWEPGIYHPMLRDFSMRDRACPNLNALQCASTYNLSMEVTTQDITDDDGNVTEPGTSFEVWPTEHVDFTFDGVEMRFVNVWSYTYREINPDCIGPYDYSAQRKSFFVTRATAAPAE